MKINCASHYDVCRNKNIENTPKIYLHKPVIRKKDGKKFVDGFETFEYNKDLGSEGIKAFLQVRREK